jgi:POT family proton-dependent oligopeptide transporter
MVNNTTTTERSHPKGLPFLFLTEMWERFGYYLMLGIFVLYMIDADKGGLQIPDVSAYDIFGTFIAITYLTPFIGGFLADRKLGYTKSIYLGGSLMGLGYMALSVPTMGMFYTGIVLIVLGNGFFKPSISTLLGNLYSEEPYVKNKDAGYNIFYMGINIGAFICNFFAAYMRNKFDWGAAFMTAGIGMFVGLIVFTIGRKHYKHVDVIKPVSPGDMSISSVFAKVFLPAIIAGVIGYFLPNIFGQTDFFGSKSTDVFYFATVPIVIFYISLYVRAEKSEKRPIAALLAIFAISVMFWAVFKQNGTALTTWAKYYTDREVSQSVEKPLSSLYLVEKIPATDTIVTQYDENYSVVKDESGQAVKAIGKDVYLRNIDPENLKSNPQTLYLISPELFQSINPFWVVALTPLVVGVFVMLRRRKREPSTASKIVIGLFISALSTLVMVSAVYFSSNGSIKVSPMWLIACYGVITVGELFLSPMGLSLVSKLSPPRITALMMGGFFLSTAIGNKLSAVLASTWFAFEDKANFFLMNFGLLLLSTLFGVAILKWMNKIMKEKGLH